MKPNLQLVSLPLHFYKPLELGVVRFPKLNSKTTKLQPLAIMVHILNTLIIAAAAVVPVLSAPYPLE